jgi:hypothetical protein
LKRLRAYHVSVDLVYGYPAILIGLGAGLMAAWRRWPISPILAVGAIAFAALVLHESTVPRLPSPEGNGSYTTAVWAMFALVNAGSWALGIAMGVAVVGVTRRDIRV